MEQLTKEQALAVMGFTGVSTLRFDIFHDECEKRLGRPLWTHQFAEKELMLEIKEAFRADFLAICPTDPAIAAPNRS